MSSKTIILEVKYLGEGGRGFPRKLIRIIELKETQTFDDLTEFLIDYLFKWYDPHLYSFFLDNKAFSEDKSKEYSCDPEQDSFDEQESNPTSTSFDDIGFNEKQKFLMIFDFGDNHQFEINVKSFGVTKKGKKYPLLLESIGEAPKQYS